MQWQRNPRQAVPYHAAITNLATIRGRYAPVWAMAGTGTQKVVNFKIKRDEINLPAPLVSN